MWQQIREIYLYREMLRNLISKEIRARYKASFLGFIWTFANPLLMLAIYSIVFGYMMKSQVQHYTMFLFVALLPWNCISQTVLQGSASLTQNSNLVKKIYFPRALLPLSIVCANVVNYLLGLIILVPALILSHITLTFVVIAFPVILLIQTLFVVSLTLIVAVGNVYLRDLEHLVNVMVMMWFFLTPVLYKIDSMPAKIRPLFNLNPAAAIIDAYREIFFYGSWPNWAHLGWLALTLVGVLFICWSLFMRLQRDIAEEI